MDEKAWEHYSGPLPVLVQHFLSWPQLFKRWIYNAIHGVNFCSVDRTIIYWCLLDDDLSSGGGGGNTAYEMGGGARRKF